MFDALQKAFEIQNPHIVKCSLQIIRRALGFWLEERVKCIGYTIFAMLSLSNIDYVSQIHEEPSSSVFQEIWNGSHDDNVITNQEHGHKTSIETWGVATGWETTT